MGSILPDQSTLSAKKAPILETATATDYTASSSAGKGLATAENRGDLDEFTVTMPAVEAELNGLLQTVAAKWPHPMPNKPRVKISLGNEYQAVTFPDGVILIDLGALDSLQGQATTDLAVTAGYVQSDQELLYMLSHEFAHYALGHHNKTDFFAQVRGASNSLAGLHNASATLSRMKYVHTGNGQGKVVVQDQKGLNNDVNKAVGLFERVDVLQRGGVSPAWNRAQEDEADALALDLMKSAGVNGPFYGDVFSKLKQQEKLSDALMGNLKSSVTQTQQQLLTPASLNAMMSGQAQQTTQTTATQVWDSFQKQTFSSVSNYLGATHRDPDVRLKGISTYEENAYPDADPFDAVDPTTKVIAKIRANAQFKDAKVATIAYYDAVAAHADGDMVKAEVAINRALGTSFKNQAAILYRAGRIAESAGKTDKAIGYYQQALADPSANPEAFRALAALQIDKRDYNGANATMAKGEKQLADADYFLPTRILMAARQNKTADVVTLTLKCRATNREDLVTACEAHRSDLDASKLTPQQRAQLDQQQARDTGTNIINSIQNLIPGQGQKQ